MKKLPNIKKNNKFIPLWAINDDFSKDITYKRIKQYSEIGIKEVIVWPSTGLEVEFLSEDFFNRYSDLIDIAKQFKLKIWIYDSYNWPSPTSAGKITEKFPEFRQQYLEYLIIDDVDNSDIFIPNEIVSAYLIDSDNKIINLKGYYKNNYLSCKIKNKKKILIFYKDFFEGKLKCNQGSKWSKKNSFYIDLLNKKSVDKFIEFNLEPFKRYFREDFGKTIVGIYTDEPAILMRLPGFKRYLPEGFAYPWTNAIENKFKEQYGYNLTENLYKLVIDVTESKKFRIDFFEVISKLYESAFNKNLSKWCYSNNLKLTGHLLFEEEIPQFISCEANYYKNMKYYSFPGIDTLGTETGIDIEKRDIAPKLVSSIGNIEKLDHILCEVFAGISLEAGFEDFKKIILWLIIFGINIIVPSKICNSIKGLRKRTIPPILNYQPYWRGFEDFIKIFESYSLILENSKDISEIGMLYPTINFWANFKPNPKDRNDEWEILEFFLIKKTKLLLRNQINFNYVFEEIATAENLKVVDGNIFLKNIKLNLLILPPLNYIHKKFIKFIYKFIKLGGIVINTSTLVKNYINCENSIINIENDNFNNILDNKYLIEKIFYKIEGKNSEFIYTNIREYNKDIKILFLNNQNVKEDFRGVLTIYEEDIKKLELWSLEDKLIYDSTDLLNCENKKIRVKINIMGNDLAVLVLYKNESVQNELIDELHLKYSESNDVIKSIFKKSIKSNPYYFLYNLNIDKKSQKIKFINKNFWKFKVWNNYFVIEDVYIKRDDNFEGKKRGYFKLNLKMRNWKKIKIANIGSYNYRISENRTHSYKTPGEIDVLSTNFWIRGYFEVSEAPKKIYLVYEELENFFEVYINGVIVNNKRELINLWDESNRAINITDYLKKGRNVFAILTRTPDWKGYFPANNYVEPIALVGNFIVKNNKIKKNIGLVKLNSWTEEGFPYFWGTGSYENKFIISSAEINKIKEGKKLFLLITDLKEIAEIYINRKKVKRILWKPYFIDISDFILEGVNTITINVSNTISNLYVNRKESGILGDVILYLI